MDNNNTNKTEAEARAERWANAPATATHWGPDCESKYGCMWVEAFYEDIGDGLWLIRGGRFDKGNPTVHSDWPERMATLEARP